MPEVLSNGQEKARLGPSVLAPFLPGSLQPGSLSPAPPTWVPPTCPPPNLPESFHPESLPPAPPSGPPTWGAPQAALREFGDGPGRGRLFQSSCPRSGGTAWLVERVLTAGPLELRERWTERDKVKRRIFGLERYKPGKHRAGPPAWQLRGSEGTSSSRKARGKSADKPAMPSQVTA